jgi:hypothetical protein
LPGIRAKRGGVRALWTGYLIGGYVLVPWIVGARVLLDR